MRPKTVQLLWIAASFLIAAWVGAYVLTAVGERKGTKSFLAGASLSEKDIQEITLETLTERVILRRTDSGWELTSPEEYPADAETVDMLAEALARAQVEDRVSARKEKLSDFDLGSKQGVRLEVKGRGGAVLVSGRLGKPLVGQFDRSYFVFDDSSDVYVVRLARHQFERSSSAFRDLTILKAPAQEIASIEMRRGRQDIRLTASDGGWSVNGKPADSEKALEVVQVFVSLQADEFVRRTADANLKEWGLEQKPKELSAIVNLRDGKSYAFWVGRKEGSYYYVKLAAKPVVWKLAEWKLAPLLKADIKTLSKSKH